jgi:SAM-dependent methyltransferase
MNSEIVLVCPNCQIELAKDNRELFCPSCAQSWSIEKDIPWFSKSSPYWGEIDQASMQRLNSLARQKGWKSALHQIAPQLSNYVTASSRTNWTSLLPLNPDWTALDIGAGWGGNAFPLSEHLKHVVALEVVLERAEFMEIRRQQEARDNLQVVAASIHAMPLPRERFNLVVMNGILEWVALSAEGDPGGVQKQILRRVHDLLAEDGWLYLGIENRFSFEAFLGAQDDSGVPFTSLMPRKMADLYMQRIAPRHNRTHDAMSSYRTYTYSYWGYKRLLERCGFKDFQAWGTYSYNRPKLLYNLQDASEFKERLNGRSPVSMRKKLIHVLAATGASHTFLRLFSPAFCILARK